LLPHIAQQADGKRISRHFINSARPLKNKGACYVKGRLISERQTVHNPETGNLLWTHETTHGYSDRGLATRLVPDGLPPVAWLTYGSGYLAGMKLGDIPLAEFTRDRLHRETVRRFGTGADSTAGYEQTSAYILPGRLQSQHLNLPQSDREYTWNDNGQLIRISGPDQTREYRYSATGRLAGVRTLAADLDISIPYATDPAGNRLAAQLEPEHIPERKIHLYHCDHRGLPNEDNPHNLEQLIRLPGQQYDEESGLYYNRHRYYDPLQGRYITQDPIGLRGGWNPYTYPLNPVADIDPLGLIVWMVIPGVCAAGGCEAILVGLGLSASIAGQQMQVNSSNSSGQSGSSFWDDGRQSEYEHAKMFCDTPPPPGSNECSSLSKKIGHSKECINLYENWDSRWLPGRHDEKLDGWRQRLNNLKEEHNKKCTK